MKIAYILDEDISINSGVVQKIGIKTTLWAQDGHTVKIVSLRSKSNDPVIPGAEIVSIRKEVNLVSKFFTHIKNIRKLRRVLNAYVPDIIYCRHIKYSPGLVKSLKGSARYVVEVNTNDRKEFMLINPRVGTYNRLTRNVLYKNCSGLVAVTKELANDPDFTRFKKPTVIIANGVVGFQELMSEKISRERYTFGFIGTPGQPWHGLDKVIALAKELPEYDFHVIGPSEEDMKKEHVDGTVPANIRPYGYLKKDESVEVLRQCDVGISTLAIDRKGLTEASPLKTREYMLLGLPVIIGYKDTDLEDDTPFVLNIGIGEENVSDHIEDISRFIQKSRSLNPETTIAYAAKRFDSLEKESRRLEFLKQIATDE